MVTPNQVKEGLVIKFISTKNYSFSIEDGSEKGKWFNFDSQGKDENMAEMEVKLRKLNKGDTVSVEVDGSNFISFEVTKEVDPNKIPTYTPQQASTPQPTSYTPNSTGYKGQDKMKLDELLTKAHSVGYIGQDIDYRHVDYDKEVAHIVATVYMRNPDGDMPHRFTASAHKKKADLDANTQQDFWVEIIETRAVKRALNFATNQGKLEGSEETVDKNESNGESNQTDNK